MAQGSGLTVRHIDRDQHARFIDTLPWASYLQTPTWASMEARWPRESVGWFTGGGADPVGVATVLQRPVPGLKRLTFAYLPEGPVIDWSAARLDDWLVPLARFLRTQGAFGIRIGPVVPVRRWSAPDLKTGLADPAVHSLADLPPSATDPAGVQVVDQLERSGWRSQAVAHGWGAGQPQLNFHVRLGDGGEDALLRGMNQQWRRNLRKAEASGTVVTRMDALTPEDSLRPELRRFYDLYVHTAERDGFDARELEYFQRMFAALRGEVPDRISLFVARHAGDVVAASILVHVGTRTWYAYGASSSLKREVHGSTAVQWAMMRRSLELGADLYDMRGVTSALDDEGGRLIRFKVGTGGELVEYAGEWDLPLVRPVYAAFRLYTRSR